MNISIETRTEEVQNNRNNKNVDDKVFFSLFSIFQVTCVFMYGFFTEYGNEVIANSYDNATSISNTISGIPKK